MAAFKPPTKKQLGWQVDHWKRAFDNLGVLVAAMTADRDVWRRRAVWGWAVAAGLTLAVAGLLIKGWLPL
jgi:hypothetical protein